MIINVLLIIYLIYCSYLDLKTGEIPKKVTFIPIVLGVIINLFNQNILILFIAVNLFILGIIINKKGYLGGADVEIFIGIFLLSSLKIFILSGCISYLFIVAYSKITGQTKQIKFVPFILIGYFLSELAFLLFL